MQGVRGALLRACDASRLCKARLEWHGDPERPRGRLGNRQNILVRPPMNRQDAPGSHSAVQRFRAEWAVLDLYQRFEQIVAMVLSAVIAVIIAVSLWQLITTVYLLLLVAAFNPLDHKIFQTVFGMIMTLLIAMEFKHSIIKVAFRYENIIQVKTVLLIALIALARKFVILDPDVSPAQVAALAGATLALGATYWLLRERDDRSDVLAKSGTAPRQEGLA